MLSVKGCFKEIHFAVPSFLISIKSKVSSLEFKEEYRGNQIPEGKKSIMFTFTIGDGLTTMTSEEINKVMDGIIKTLNKTCGATLRE